MNCGSYKKFNHLVSCNTIEYHEIQDDASKALAALQQRCVTQPSDRRAIRRKYSLVRAWRLRRSELQVLVDRAECRQEKTQNYVTLADCTLIAKRYEPVDAVKHGDEVHAVLRQVFRNKLARTLPSEPVRQILGFSEIAFSWHDEQFTLAEYSAYIVRDVAAHIDLAAEARIKDNQPGSKLQAPRMHKVNPMATATPKKHLIDSQSKMLETLGGKKMPTET